VVVCVVVLVVSCVVVLVVSCGVLFLLCVCVCGLFLFSRISRPDVQGMIDAPETAEWRGFSIEFCGGTHIARTSEPKTFVLLAEEGMGGGVRRIVGLTGDKADVAIADAKVIYKHIGLTRASICIYMYTYVYIWMWTVPMPMGGGVRRIVGLTGDKADAAIANAKVFMYTYTCT